MIRTIEEVYDGLKTYIEDNLENVLEEFDTIDEIKVPMFKKVLRTSVVDILGLKNYPTLMMEYDRITVERETTTSDRYQIPISLYAISSGSNGEMLQKKAERYLWALKQLFERDDTLGGMVDTVIIGGYDFSPALQRQQVFVHFGVLDVILDVLIRRK